MLNKKWIGAVLLASAAFSTSALADDRGVNTALGAVLGAVIGNSVGGQNGTVIGGVLGAVAGATLSSHDDRSYRGRQAYRAPVYYRPVPVRSQPHYRGHPVARRDYRQPRQIEYVAYGRDFYRR
jgi:hypothetical protein